MKTMLRAYVERISHRSDPFGDKGIRSLLVAGHTVREIEEAPIPNDQFSTMWLAALVLAPIFIALAVFACWAMDWTLSGNEIGTVLVGTFTNILMGTVYLNDLLIWRTLGVNRVRLPTASEKAARLVRLAEIRVWMSRVDADLGTPRNA